MNVGDDCKRWCVFYPIRQRVVSSWEKCVNVPCLRAVVRDLNGQSRQEARPRQQDPPSATKPVQRVGPGSSPPLRGAPTP